MSAIRCILRPALITCAAIGLSACTSSYTGPIEVTRFVAEPQASVGDQLGKGTIGLEFPDEIANLTARNAFTAAIAEQLSQQGYTVILNGEAQPTYRAIIRTTRTSLAPASSRGPVNVGFGGSTGSYGSGLGVGIGINLGGGSSGPNVLSQLAVRISGPDGTSLWEGRAQQPVSIKSPYADVDASARALARALFINFPGGNGETVSINVDDLQE